MRVLLACMLLVLGSWQARAETLLEDLRADYQVTPMTLESGQPVFSWQMRSDEPGQRQVAYALRVWSESGERVWDSGRVDAATSVAIAYAGESLEPTRRYRWQVTVWPESGEPVVAESWFETGFMKAGDRTFSGAEWIGGEAEDRVLRADYLTVFRLDVGIQLDRESDTRTAAILYGGNDFRLQDPTYNIQGMDNGEGESFIAVELDIGELAEGAGPARIHLYRLGYAPEDSLEKPLASLPIPEALINRETMYERHSIHLDSVLGVTNVFINGQSLEHRVTPYDPGLPPHNPQGVNINPLAFAGAIEPAGNPGDYIGFPAVGSIGFWLKPGQVADFSDFEIRHHRAPANVLFATGNPTYPELFLNQGERGILPADDGGYRIAAGTEPVQILADPSRLSMPMLRTEFALEDKPIARARLYATARGIYELYLNGERVGDSYFAPDLTQYDKRHLYQAYDVTGMLHRGDNAIGAWLGEGWWSGNITFNAANWNYFGDRQSLLAKLVVTYEDGSTREIDTRPDTWRVSHRGPIRYGSFFQGEVYDARREAACAGWTEPGYDDADWGPAQTVALDGNAFMAEHNDNPDSNELITGYGNLDLEGQVGESPRIVQTLEAQSVEEVRPGVFVYDMGQNMVGFPRIELSSAEPGQRIVMRYAEVTYPDLPEHEGLAGMLMMENIRAALTHDIYIARGGDEVIQPRFTFHGYRFLEVTGIDRPLPLEAVQGRVISSLDELTAGYRTSNSRVNKLWENITWSMRGNFLSIPTDTPARNERMGWNGDINVFMPTAAYLGDIDPFMRRHLAAMRDIQGDSGRFTDVAPINAAFGGMLWGSAGIRIPWELYRQYGDRQTLATHYPAMVGYADFLWQRIDEKTGVMTEGPLGDWLSPEGRKNDNSLLWEAYHVYVLDVMARAAGALDKPTDAQRFRERHAQRKAFFNTTYVDVATGRTVHSGVPMGIFVDPAAYGQLDEALRGQPVDTQASYAVPIALGVFDEANLPRAREHLANAVQRENVDDAGVARPACSLMTGFIGTSSIMPALSDAGRDDLAYCLLQQESYPSWLYSVVNGATTIWERLNSYTREEGFGGNNSMNSFNHYSFGAVGAWMLGHSLGIQRDPDSPAFQRFVLRPTPDPEGRMTWAEGFYDSMYGRIESEWRIGESGTTAYRFRVPANSEAVLYLEAQSEDRVSFEAGATVEPLGRQQNRVAFRLLPGVHSFKVD